MTLTFPRDMPALGPAQQYFEPESVDYLTPTARGRFGGVQAGATLWSAEWTLGRMGMVHAEEWRAWIASLRGPKRLFYGRDFARPMPMLYPSFTGMTRAGGGAFDGAATSWSIDGTASVLTLNGLPAAFMLSIGDYVGLRWTTGGQQRRALVRTVEPRTASGAGSAGFAVEPPLPTVVPGDAVAYLNNPTCLMRMTTDSRVTPMDRRRAIGGNLKAVQELLP